MIIDHRCSILLVLAFLRPSPNMRLSPRFSLLSSISDSRGKVEIRSRPRGKMWESHSKKTEKISWFSVRNAQLDKELGIPPLEQWRRGSLASYLPLPSFISTRPSPCHSSAASLVIVQEVWLHQSNKYLPSPRSHMVVVTLCINLSPSPIRLPAPLSSSSSSSSILVAGRSSVLFHLNRQKGNSFRLALLRLSSLFH